MVIPLQNHRPATPLYIARTRSMGNKLPMRFIRRQLCQTNPISNRPGKRQLSMLKALTRKTHQTNPEKTNPISSRHQCRRTIGACTNKPNFNTPSRHLTPYAHRRYKDLAQNMAKKTNPISACPPPVIPAKAGIHALRANVLLTAAKNAKQTQFQIRRMNANPLKEKSLQQKQPEAPLKKQTQFRSPAPPSLLILTQSPTETIYRPFTEPARFTSGVPIFENYKKIYFFVQNC